MLSTKKLRLSSDRRLHLHAFGEELVLLEIYLKTFRVPIRCQLELVAPMALFDAKRAGLGIQDVAETAGMTFTFDALFCVKLRSCLL